jgi:hypothetical protein
MDPATLILASGVLWISPETPPNDDSFILDRAVSIVTETHHCEFDDTNVTLEISFPKGSLSSKNGPSTDPRTLCLNLKCLIETGEACWTQ